MIKKIYTLLVLIIIGCSSVDKPQIKEQCYKVYENGELQHVIYTLFDQSGNTLKFHSNFSKDTIRNISQHKQKTDGNYKYYYSSSDTIVKIEEMRGDTLLSYHSFPFDEVSSYEIWDKKGKTETYTGFGSRTKYYDRKFDEFGNMIEARLETHFDDKDPYYKGQEYAISEFINLIRADARTTQLLKIEYEYY